jgi:hypothetical protein
VKLPSENNLPQQPKMLSRLLNNLTSGSSPSPADPAQPYYPLLIRHAYYGWQIKQTCETAGGTEATSSTAERKGTEDMYFLAMSLFIMDLGLFSRPFP